MGRRREGSAYERPEKGSGRWFISILLDKAREAREGRPPRKRWVLGPLEPRKDGLAWDYELAKADAHTLQKRYDQGLFAPPVAGEEKAVELAADPTLLEWARSYLAKRSYISVGQDRAFVERYLAPHELANRRLSEIRPKHLAAFVEWLKTRPVEKWGPGHTIAAWTVRQIWGIVGKCLRASVVEELLAAAPELPPNVLPPAEDRIPGSRKAWKFPRTEIELLISDELIPEYRRVSYALAFIAGPRFGEITVLRWDDYDPTAEPLGKLTVARAWSERAKIEKRTKTGAIREHPVHPTLAGILAEWRLAGFEAAYGRKPTAADRIVYAPDGGLYFRGAAYKDLARDCAARGLLGLGPGKRRLHGARHSFISLTQSDGAAKAILQEVTHAKPRAAFDTYSDLEWRAVCAEVAKLKIERRRPQVVALPLRAVSGGEAEASGVEAEAAGRESEAMRKFTDSSTGVGGSVGKPHVERVSAGGVAASVAPPGRLCLPSPPVSPENPTPPRSDERGRDTPRPVDSSTAVDKSRETLSLPEPPFLALADLTEEE